MLRALGVEHAHITIVDEGALPFVIAARIEAAVVAPGLLRRRDMLCPRRLLFRRLRARDRLRRSRLYLPGNEPKYFINAGLHARTRSSSIWKTRFTSPRRMRRAFWCATRFAQWTSAAAERMVRINQLPLGSRRLAGDRSPVAGPHPDPKGGNPSRSRPWRKRSTLIQSARVTRPIWLMPILESALGIENAFAIATASERIVALTIGLEDYTADLGVAKTSDGAESLYARMRVVNAAHAAHVQAIDSVYGDVADTEGLLRWGEASRAMGFEGMGCIHPIQIEIIHRAFAPTAAELEKALKIVAAYEEAQARGLGVVSLGSKMIDAPVVQRALKLVARAKQMGLIA